MMMLHFENIEKNGRKANEPGLPEQSRIEKENMTSKLSMLDSDEPNAKKLIQNILVLLKSLVQAN